MAENGNRRQEQLNKLAQLDKAGVKASNKTRFDNLVVINVGVPRKEHFPKLKNADGSKKVDADGHDVRSEKSDGFTYTFAQYGTANKVMAVISKQYGLDRLGVYVLSGLGYNMRQNNMIFLDENVNISNY